MTGTQCGKCGAAFVPDGIGTGYATLRNGARVCYSCADDMQRADMRQETSYVAYLSGDGSRLTTWTGGELARVVREREDSGTGWYGTRLTHIRAVAPDGSLWYGKGAGRGMAIKVRRAKASSRIAA